MKDKKAYIVRHDDGAVIKFAYSNVVARRNGANDLDIEFEDIESCRRAPEFDEYHYTEKVPSSVLLFCGWWLSSLHTGNEVSEDYHPNYYIDSDDNVFEDFETYHDYLLDRIKRQKLKLSMIQQTKDKFPFASEIQFSHSWKGEDDSGNKNYFTTFKFSYKSTSLAEWVVGSEKVSIQKQDLDHWKEANTPALYKFKEAVKC